MLVILILVLGRKLKNFPVSSVLPYPLNLAHQLPPGSSPLPRQSSTLSPPLPSPSFWSHELPHCVQRGLRLHGLLIPPISKARFVQRQLMGCFHKDRARTFPIGLSTRCFLTVSHAFTFHQITTTLPCGSFV